MMALLYWLFMLKRIITYINVIYSIHMIESMEMLHIRQWMMIVVHEISLSNDVSPILTIHAMDEIQQLTCHRIQ